MRKIIDKLCWSVFGIIVFLSSFLSLFSGGICFAYGLMIPFALLIVIGAILLILGFKLFSLIWRT